MAATICVFVMIVLLAAHFVSIIVGGIMNFFNNESTMSDYRLAQKRIAEGAFKFTRHDIVRGTLEVDGIKIPTFNNGTICLQNGKQKAEIELALTIDECYIEDIRICDFSVAPVIPQHLDDDSKLEFALNLVDQAVKENLIPNSFSVKIREIVRDFYSFAELLEKNLVVEKVGSTDYVWLGERK